jgi:hypothetical protein
VLSYPKASKHDQDNTGYANRQGNSTGFFAALTAILAGHFLLLMPEGMVFR